jgi:hypothetical protein
MDQLNFDINELMKLGAIQIPDDFPVNDDETLTEVLNSITFVNSVVDFDWKFRTRPLTLPAALDQNTNTTVEAKEGWLMWTAFYRPDIVTGEMGWGRGRDEIILRGQRVSGIVKTAWVLFQMMLTHESMEGFRFNGVQIFNPHNTVFELMLPHFYRQFKPKA